MFNTSYQKLKQFVTSSLSKLWGLIVDSLSWLWENKITLLKIAFYFILGVLIKISKLFKKALSYFWENKKPILKFGAYSVFAGFVVLAFLFIYFSKDIPPKDAINDLFVPESTKILDRTETSILYDIYDEYNRTVISGEEIPSSIKYATIVAEDNDFYHHWGIDIKGIFRAFITNIRGKGIQQGGSTITQQYIKNLLLTPERTLARKIKEAVLAIEIEFLYTKDEILTGYLNYVPYGYNTYGVEAASRVYFNKNAKDLTLSESAMLAALPQAPSYYTNNPEALRARRDLILGRMFKLGYITEEQHSEATGEALELTQRYSAISAPHFVTMVRQYIEQKYGPTFVQQAGLRVTTTLDKTMQDAAEKAVTEQAESNRVGFNANNASLVAVDPNTGQILAMVGSKDYFGEPSPQDCISGKTCLFDPQTNITTTLQQPGSSFKPFAYAAALQKGYTPNTIIYDITTEFNPNCHWNGRQNKDVFGLDCYHPVNYDGLEFGPITLAESLAQSRNISSVKVLHLAGIENTMSLATDMGITSLRDRSGYGLALVLGGVDVTLLEQVSAFGAFATRGTVNPTQFILKIEDKNGNILEEFIQESEQVLNENIADQINYMLSENSFRTRVFGEQNYLTIGGLNIAVKTGTTQDYRDAWAVGYTPSVVAGVWVGNNNNASMRNAPGASVAAPIWNKFFREIYSNKATESSQLKEREFYFNLPSLSQEKSFVSPKIDLINIPVLDGVPQGHSILHLVPRDSPRQSGDSKDSPLYANWENAVRNWLGQNLSTPNQSSGIVEEDE